jgi:hypothetical protein
VRGIIYRLVMRIAHRYNWHYAPPIYPDGDTQLWCQWCGFRQTIKRAERGRIEGGPCKNGDTDARYNRHRG